MDNDRHIEWEEMMRTYKELLKNTLTITFAAAIGFVVAAIPVSKVQAREVLATIQGTVTKGSTADTLKLFSLNSGSYEIKIDSDTDKSKCKEIVPGKSLYVGVYKGSDSALHADRIIGAEVDTSLAKTKSTATQAALLAMKTTETTTTTTTTTTTDSNTQSSNESSIPSNTIEVTGTPTDKSSSGVLYLQTKDGLMYLVVDDNTDTSSGFMFTTSNKVTAYVYRGDDANMHVAKVVGKRPDSTCPEGSTITFSGTVESKSTEEVLYLNTSGGVMTFKIDKNTSLNNAKGLVNGKIVTISGAVGSDETWHAVSIAAK